MKSLFALTVLVCLVQYSSALKCYSCKNSEGSACGTAFNKDAKEQVSVQVVDCNTKCVSAKYSFRGDHLYERACDDGSFCSRIKGDRFFENSECKECSNELCNTDKF